MPPCPSSMLYDRAKIITVPICDRMESAAPLLKIIGATISSKAKPPQISQRARCIGL